MKKIFERAKKSKMKKEFVVLFGVLAGLAILYTIAMAASGQGDQLAVWWSRVTFARFRSGIFTDIGATFRFLTTAFVAGWASYMVVKKVKAKKIEQN